MGERRVIGPDGSRMPGNASGVDFGREHFVESLPGRTADDLVGRVLVAPRRAAPRFVDDFDDGVGRQEIVGVHWHANTIDQPEWQYRRIDVIRAGSPPPSSLVGS